MPAPTLLRLPVTMQRVNDLIWESLDHGHRTEPVAFFCECERDDCYLPVWLTLDEYREGRSRPGWLAIASSHRERMTA